MKFRTFLAIYKNIIILLWWTVILISFKIINNFEFENGTSLIFIGLLVGLPVSLYIFGLIHKIKLKKIKAINNGPFIDIIKKDIESKKFEKEFLEDIRDLKFDLIDSDNIELKNDLIQVVFTNEYAYIKLIDKKVIYRYFYVNKFRYYSKYDGRYFQYKPTTHLYTVMISKIKELSHREYIYIENRRTIKLIDKATEEIIYYMKKEKKQL